MNEKMTQAKDNLDRITELLSQFQTKTVEHETKAMPWIPSSEFLKGTGLTLTDGQQSKQSAPYR